MGYYLKRANYRMPGHDKASHLNHKEKNLNRRTEEWNGHNYRAI